MHTLKLHHLVHGKFVKKIGGFVRTRSSWLHKLSQLRDRSGGGIPAHKKIDEELGGRISRKRITPLSYKF